MTEVAAVIQARMESTRLPKKVMSPIVGHPMLWHIINRIRKAELIDKIILATTSNKEDDSISKFAEENNILLFRGSEHDVLDRYYKAAKNFNLKNIVRITADDPFKDPAVIDKIIKIYLKGKYDYASNTIKPSYPVGIDAEVFSFEAIEKAWLESKKEFEREHVTPYIWMNPDKFKIINVEYEKENLSDLRWTVDTKEDLAFAKTVYEKLYKENKIFLMKDILNLLEKNPEIADINRNVKPKNIFNEK